MLIDQHLLPVPAEADFLAFVISGGKLVDRDKEPPGKDFSTESITLLALRDKYVETHSIGAMEKSSLATVSMHIGHFLRTFGESFSLANLTHAMLQKHINRRSSAKGHRGRKLSPITLRKEMASFRAVWNWGSRMGLLSGPFSHMGLVYPKDDEKPPFQTWQEIKNQIDRGNLTEAEQRHEPFGRLPEKLVFHAIAPIAEVERGIQPDEGDTAEADPTAEEIGGASTWASERTA